MERLGGATWPVKSRGQRSSAAGNSRDTTRNESPASWCTAKHMQSNRNKMDCFSAPLLLINCTRARVSFYAVLRKSGHAEAAIFNEGDVHPRRSIANSSRAAGAGSISVWAKVDELQGRVLRVVTLSDKITIHNAFLDRRFRP